jgi:hypothetical protein
MGDGEKLLTYLNSALKVLSGLDNFPRGTKTKLNFVDQCNQLMVTIFVSGRYCLQLSKFTASVNVSLYKVIKIFRFLDFVHFLKFKKEHTFLRNGSVPVLK